MNPNVIFLSADATTAVETAGSTSEFAAGSFVFIAIAAVAIVMVFAILYALFFKKKKTIADSPAENKRKIKIKSNSNVVPVNKAAAIAEEQAIKVVVKKNEPFVVPEELPKKEKKKKVKKPKRGELPEGSDVPVQKQKKKVKAIKYKPLASPDINDEQPRRIAVDYSVVDTIETRDDLQVAYENEFAAMTASEPMVDLTEDSAVDESAVALSKEHLEEETIAETPVDLFKDSVVEVEEEQPVVSVPEEQPVVSVPEEQPIVEESTTAEETPSYMPYTNKFSKVTDIFGERRILIASEESITASLVKADVVNVEDIADHGPYKVNDVVTFKVEAPFKCGVDVKYAIGISSRVQGAYQLLDVKTDDAYDGTHQFIEISAALRIPMTAPTVDVEYGFDKSFNGKYLMMVLRVA